MVRTADVKSEQLRSGSFSFAISSTFAVVNFPTNVFLGFAEPFFTFAACLIKNAAGGVFSFKLKDLSSKTEISTGITLPIFSAVFELYSLQKLMILTPLAPNAGPTGGDGFALPASSASLIVPTILEAWHTCKLVLL